MNKILNTISTFFEAKSKWITVFIPVIILSVFFFLMTLNNMYSRTYDIERFNRAKETIRAPITMENEVETERKMRETVVSVVDRYSILEEVTEEQINNISEVFDAINTFTENEEKTTKKDKDKMSYDEIVTQLNELLSTEITNDIDDVLLMKLYRLKKEDRTEAEKLLKESAHTVLEKGVRTENIQSAKEELKSMIKYSTLKSEMKDILYDLIDFVIIENSFFDVEKTMQARNEAASNVEPVVIRAGDVIVREGQVITNEIYEELKLVGLLNKERKVYPGVGLAIFILLLNFITGYELLRLYKRNQLKIQTMLVVVLISVLVVSVMKIVSLFSNSINDYFLLVPVATGVLLIRLLSFERISIMLAVVFALLGSIIFNDEIPGTLNFEAGIYFLFFQIAGIYALTNLRDKVSIVKSALYMILANLLTILMFIFLSIEKYQLLTIFIKCSFGISAAILAAVLTIGLLAFFETGLGILTDNKLLSLANPNQPLIRKILTESPGTYHHSVMVANLSETACEAIGANGLLARVGSYYHDIGKTLQPHYFIENQLAIRNPHDFIDPKKSAQIIISHVTEGAKMLKEKNIPEEIIDITLQHHGTSLVSFFYHKAKEIDENVVEKDFRYPGPKPQTKEAGVISICDATEAAVRSLKEPSPEKIEEIVTSIVNHKLMDGQFDETPLTLQDIHLIRESVCESLKGIFHSRIEYPKEEE